jgi:hypothetical protein
LSDMAKHTSLLRQSVNEAKEKFYEIVYRFRK